MLALISSVLVLFLAPLLSTAMARRPAAGSAFDGFVLIVSFGSVTLGLLPEVVAATGWLGLIFVLIGFLLPTLAETLFHRTADGTHRLSLIIAAAVLVIHALADGALLAGFGDHGGHNHGGHDHGFIPVHEEGLSWIMMPMLLHRFGIALTLWWLLRPYFSRPVRLAILSCLAVSTFLGYWGLLAGLSHGAEVGIDVLLAFGCGSLLHILLHPLATDEKAPSKTSVLAHKLGTAAGLVMVIAMIAAHMASHGHADVINHGIDHLIDTGLHLAPLLLALFLAFPITQTLINISEKPLEKSISLAAALGILMWLISGLLLPDLIHTIIPKTALSPVLWSVWLAVVMAVLTRQGARPFLAGLSPHRFFHRHSH